MNSVEQVNTHPPVPGSYPIVLACTLICHLDWGFHSVDCRCELASLPIPLTALGWVPDLARPWPIGRPSILLGIIGMANLFGIRFAKFCHVPNSA